LEKQLKHLEIESRQEKEMLLKWIEEKELEIHGLIEIQH